jgi:hypothetical protein
MLSILFGWDKKLNKFLEEETCSKERTFLSGDKKLKLPDFKS